MNKASYGNSRIYLWSLATLCAVVAILAIATYIQRDRTKVPQQSVGHDGGMQSVAVVETLRTEESHRPEDGVSSAGHLLESAQTKEAGVVRPIKKSLSDDRPAEPLVIECKDKRANRMKVLRKELTNEWTNVNASRDSMLKCLDNPSSCEDMIVDEKCSKINPCKLVCGSMEK